MLACTLAFAATASVFDDVKVWYKGAAGNEAGTADSGGASAWSGNICRLKSLTGGGVYDGGQYFWWGYRLQYRNIPVKLPYANVDLGEAPCVEFPGLDAVGSNKEGGTATVTVDGQEVGIGRVDYVLRAIRLEPGKHTVVFRFDPQSIHVTERIAYLSFGILSVLFLFSLLYPTFRARRRSDS